ncbi:hypothetical protein N7474_000119 [Penicillium riverlandense]|uniref:uncharacterized protein n=1 Tax=Penicillium riverlandense TaxID=1903569 RepID=UPI0025490CB5|nr:uncharacterized protein N7474_000119 [Penicillium riverlandense]KAJ5831808.1 hypothetical protein N7474_000119 [Penicillium riverlandense]
MNQPSLAHRLSLRLISPLGIASRGMAKKLWRRLRPIKIQISSPVLKPLPDALDYQRASSPSYRGVSYNRISTLMDVDYFRGSTNPGGKNSGILKVLNPDPSSKASSVDVRGKPFSIAPNPPIGAGPPRLPVLSFMVSPDPPLSSMIATALEGLRCSPHASWITEEEDMSPSSPPASEMDSRSDVPSQPTTKHTIARKPLPCPKDILFPLRITSDYKRDWNMARLGCHRQTSSNPSTTETITVKNARHSIQTTECFTSVSADNPRSSFGAKSWTSQDVYRNKQSHIAAYLATLDYSEIRRGVAPSIHSLSTRVSSGISSVSGVSRGTWRNNSVVSGPDELSFVAIAGLVAQHRRGLGGVLERNYR